MPSRYSNIEKTKVDNIGNTYYVNNIYQDIPISQSDNYVICVLGDRLDLLAKDFYGDTSLWWIIASANALPGDSIYPPIGMQLRIPSDISPILNGYNKINFVR